jgi:predicted DNA-binding transcriptional regulator YafY
MNPPPTASNTEFTSPPPPETAPPRPAAANRNSSRFAQWRQREMHARFSAHFEAYRKNPLTRLWNRNTLAAELGCKPKTIGKDLATMKESLGYPLQFYPEKHGWMYTEPFTPVLAPSITKSELARISLAFRAIEALKDSPLFAPVLEDIDKLIRTLTEHLGSEFAELASCVTFKTTGIDPMLDPAIFDALVTAIRGRQELEIVYSKLNRDGEPDPTPPSSVHAHPSSAHTATLPHPAAPWLQVPVETRIVHPLHLLSQDNALYLFLWDAKRQDFRRFALSRMRSVKPTGKTCKPRKFDVEKQIHSLTGVTSGKPVDVRVLFRGKASFLVAERPYHHSQKLAPGPDAEWNLEVTLKATHNPELERWIIGYDKDARVLEPAALAESIANKGTGIQQNYRSESAPL